jgi:hypothetical protein
MVFKKAFPIFQLDGKMGGLPINGIGFYRPSPLPLFSENVENLFQIHFRYKRPVNFPIKSHFPPITPLNRCFAQETVSTRIF